MKTKEYSFALVIIFNVLFFIVLLAIFEGGSSIILVSVDLYKDKRGRIAEYLHTKYDEELGWVNVPGKTVPDMYGPGKSVTINRQGFRDQNEFAIQSPPKKSRIVCSGDSFTFGYGVSDESTWCHFLAHINDNIETINMGQGGYGLDQAYLWYMRDGRQFDHDVHVFAFIAEGFKRALTDRFQGYPKPVLKVEKGELKTMNVPLPRTPYAFRWLTDYRDNFDQLRFFELVRTLSRPKQVNPSDEEISQLFFTLFDSLQREHLSTGRILLLVYLPTRNDLHDDHNAELRNWLNLISSRKGWEFLDLTGDFKKLTPDDLEKLFIPDKAHPGFRNAGGHYTEAGNAFVAQLLHRHLYGMSEIKQKMRRISSEPH